jgi:peptidyl-prolyl cis-trans isomerase C
MSRHFGNIRRVISAYNGGCILRMNAKARTPVLCTAVILAAALAACGDKAEKKPGQALASVNGHEITVLQLNEELQRSNVPAAQQEVGRKRLLEALVDRQLLEDEAAKEKLDRDPKVMQSIERAKSQIVAQAYLQKRIGAPTRPSRAEVEAYYTQNPQFFANRKVFDMRQVVMATSDMTAAVKSTIDSSKTLDEVAAFLDQQKIRYSRGQLARSSTDMPQELTTRLMAIPKGQMFIVREGERSVLLSINDVKDAPVALDQAAPQIEQFLVNKKNKEAAEAEIKRLRASAKIEYMNKADAPAASKAPAAAAVPGQPGTEAKLGEPAPAALSDQAVSGLK